MNVYKIIRKAKCDFVKAELNNNVNDSKKFWRNIQEIWPNKKANSSKIILIDQDTQMEIKQEDTAYYINQFFTGIGPSLAQNLNDPWEYNGIVADRHINYIDVNEIELTNLFKEIDVNKSSSI